MVPPGGRARATGLHKCSYTGLSARAGDQLRLEIGRAGCVHEGRDHGAHGTLFSTWHLHYCSHSLRSWDKSGRALEIVPEGVRPHSVAVSGGLASL